MSNSISSQISITNVGNDGRNVLSTTSTTNTTSSYGYLVGTTPATSSAWTAVNLSALPDILLFTAINDNTTYTASMISISGSLSDGTPVGGKLIPGVQGVYPLSGSIGSLAVKVTGGWPPGTATQVLGSVNWTAQGLA